MDNGYIINALHIFGTCEMLNLTRILNGFSRRFGKVVFNVKLSNLVDSDVAPQSSYLSN